MAKSATSKLASVALRVLSLVLLVIALIVISINQATDSYTLLKLRFQDIIAYRYVISSIVIGIAYTIVQLALTIYTLTSNTQGNLVFDFFGDKIISYLLATGAAAGFGVTNDMKTLIEALSELDFGDFYTKGYAAASMLFLAFVCNAALSVLSSYALPKNLDN